MSLELYESEFYNSRRWPQPSKMKVSDDSELGYEFPVDYLEWDRSQLNKILQRSIFKNPVWLGMNFIFLDIITAIILLPLPWI